MSKLSSFVRKYGDEIGTVGKILFMFITKIPLDLNDKKVMETEAQNLIDASQRILASYKEIESVLPTNAQVTAAVKAQLPDLVKATIQTVVASIVKAEIEKLLGNGPPPITSPETPPASSTGE